MDIINCRTLHDYFIDLSGKRASVREEALSTILKALTLNIEQKFVELNFVTLVYQCLHFIKKGSPTEMKQAAHIIGLLSMITTTVEKVHEAYEDVLTALSQGGLKPKLKTLEILGCLTVVTFFGASNSDETESVMKLLWDLINPGTDSSLKFLKHFLRNDGFVKHMMENENFHNVFDFHPKRRNDWGNVLYVPEREEVTILLFRPMVARHNDCSLLPSLTRDKQLAKKKTMSPNSHLSKARTQLLKKQRDLSLKEREFDCFDY
ncbi:hypothetical protein GOBAR_AA26531 [Gossypium barbadense]|uniref:Interferon-related developmental regulator N-terminal domain-containing protein n=1 Tax=Gossypium barbadense TaxID=3634 RepID=A0A2P5WST8_GOSBA|nr:hypothetical protein GOBAR_AA26531 [Gossypium barbadense]